MSFFYFCLILIFCSQVKSEFLEKEEAKEVQTQATEAIIHPKGIPGGQKTQKPTTKRGNPLPTSSKLQIIFNQKDYLFAIISPQSWETNSKISP